MPAPHGNFLAAKWLPEHDIALRTHLAAELSYSQAAAKINAEFRTSYSRNAAIGRGNRIGLKSLCPNYAGERKPRRKKGYVTADGIVERTRRRKAKPQQFACDETGHRVADVVPLHLSLIDLDVGQCRWPYGDGSAALPYTFCGCEQFEGSSYCANHVALSTQEERTWSDERRARAAAWMRKLNGFKGSFSAARKYGDAA